MYADDLVIFGDFKLSKFAEVLKDYGFSINLKKSCSFRKHQQGIALRKSYCDLGTKINDRGIAVGQTKVISILKSKAKNIGKLSRHNPRKALLFLMSLCGGACQLPIRADGYEAKPRIAGVEQSQYATSLKQRHSLQHSHLLSKKSDIDSYSHSLMRLTKLDGVIRWSKKRIIVRWSDWYYSKVYVEKKIAKIKSEIPVKKQVKQAKSKPKKPLKENFKKNEKPQTFNKTKMI